MAGYRARFYYTEMKADAAMESRLNKDQYDENDLISILAAIKKHEVHLCDKTLLK